MMNPQRDDLLSEADRRKVRALGASRSRDAVCTHQVLIKVIDRLGMMTTVVTEHGPVTCAEVLEAHYECEHCGDHLLDTANPRAQVAYDQHLEAADKLTAVIEAIGGVRNALSQRKENRR